MYYIYIYIYYMSIRFYKYEDAPVVGRISAIWTHLV